MHSNQFTDHGTGGSHLTHPLPIHFNMCCLCRRLARCTPRSEWPQRTMRDPLKSHCSCICYSITNRYMLPMQAAGNVQTTPLMDSTHYAWPTMTLLAQIDPGAASLPSAFLYESELNLNQWICSGRVGSGPSLPQESMLSSLLLQAHPCMASNIDIPASWGPDWQQVPYGMHGMGL